MIQIDLNCDLGENMPYDGLIMPHISSCNIACGGHAGNVSTILKSLKLAHKYNVKIGAHPSFEDKKNFGRVRLELSRDRFRESVTKQLELFTSLVDSTALNLHHIKMHGALYHATAHEENYSDWLVELLQENYPAIPVYGLPNSLLFHKCHHVQHPFIAEAFVDRSYFQDSTLVPRSFTNAVLSEIDDVVNQIFELSKNQRVLSHDNEYIEVNADTFCIHGDHLLIVKRLPELIDKLNAKGIQIAK